MAFGDLDDDDEEALEERVQNLLTQFPRRELRIRSALRDCKGHAGRAALEIQNELDNADAPGRYVIVARSYIKAGVDTSSAKIEDVLPTTLVEVEEVEENEAARRIRGRLKEPAGWISLMNTETGQRWAEKVDDQPGEYRIVVPVHLKASKELHSRRVADIPRDAIVNIAEVQFLTEDKRIRGRVVGSCDGWISLQSIESGLCWARRVVKPQVKRYRVDGRHISSQRPGLNYRLSPHLDDKVQGDDRMCLYGSIIIGVQLHDWLKVDRDGGETRYLPFNVQGMRVLFEVDEGGQDIIPESAKASAKAPSALVAIPEAKVPALDFAHVPRALATAAEDMEAMMTKMPSTRLPREARLAEPDDADGDRVFEVEAALEGFPEPRPNTIFGLDPRATPDSVQGVGVIAFCFPGYPERWDELCGASFLGHHWNLGAGGISVACKTLPEAPKHFCNAEAAFHALSFWDQAERFEGLTGEEALALKGMLSQGKDPTYAGHGSAWKANLAVVRAKFRPGSPNAEALLRTQDAFLLEHVAEAFDDMMWSNNHVGDGKNWSGLQLMLVRDEISGRNADVMSWTQYISGPCQVNLETGDCRASSASDFWSDAVIGATDALQLMLGETVQRRRQTFSGLPPGMEDAAIGEGNDADAGEPPSGSGGPQESLAPGALPKEEQAGVREEPPSETPAPTGLKQPVSDEAAAGVDPDPKARPAPKRVQRTLSQAFKQRHSAAGVADPQPSPEVDPPEQAAPPPPERRKKSVFGRTLSGAFRSLEASGKPVPSRADAPADSKPDAARARPSMVTRTLSQAFSARGHQPGSCD